MKRILPLLLVLFSLSVVAQDELPWKEASKESQAYHEYRIKTTTPPYSLAKVQALIKKIKYDEENEIDALNKKSYDALSLREKFTYSMVHGESFSQMTWRLVNACFRLASYFAKRWANPARQLPRRRIRQK